MTPNIKAQLEQITSPAERKHIEATIARLTEILESGEMSNEGSFITACIAGTWQEAKIKADHENARNLVLLEQVVTTLKIKNAPFLPIIWLEDVISYMDFEAVLESLSIYISERFYHKAYWEDEIKFIYRILNPKLVFDTEKVKRILTAGGFDHSVTLDDNTDKVTLTLYQI